MASLKGSSRRLDDFDLTKYILTASLDRRAACCPAIAVQLFTDSRLKLDILTKCSQVSSYPLFSFEVVSLSTIPSLSTAKSTWGSGAAGFMLETEAQ